jgi:hypothetical protein
MLLELIRKFFSYVKDMMLSFSAWLKDSLYKLDQALFKPLNDWLLSLSNFYNSLARAPVIARQLIDNPTIRASEYYRGRISHLYRILNLPRLSKKEKVNACKEALLFSHSDKTEPNTPKEVKELMSELTRELNNIRDYLK